MAKSDKKAAKVAAPVDVKPAKVAKSKKEAKTPAKASPAKAVAAAAAPAVRSHVQRRYDRATD